VVLHNQRLIALTSGLVFFGATLSAAPCAENTSFRTDPDAVSCGYSKHSNAASVSNEVARKWLDSVVSTKWRLPMEPTSTRDPLRVDLSASKNYVGHFGGGGGSRMVYDEPHHILAVCQVYDTASAVFVFSNVSAPPAALGVPHRDLSHVSTLRGIRLGDTVDKVRRIYGPAPIMTFSEGHSGVGYQRSDSAVDGPKSPPTYTPFGVETWFEIVNGRVASLERLTGF
jgi:hypothetical protein